MAKHIIKNNLPEDHSSLLERKYGSLEGIYTSTARNMFLTVLEYLRNIPKVIVVSVSYRDEKGKPLRGTIIVDIDGFYYYVELFKIK